MEESMRAELFVLRKAVGLAFEARDLSPDSRHIAHHHHNSAGSRRCHRAGPKEAKERGRLTDFARGRQSPSHQQAPPRKEMGKILWERERATPRGVDFGRVGAGMEKPRATTNYYPVCNFPSSNALLQEWRPFLACLRTDHSRFAREHVPIQPPPMLCIITRYCSVLRVCIHCGNVRKPFSQTMSTSQRARCSYGCKFSSSSSLAVHLPEDATCAVEAVWLIRPPSLRPFPLVQPPRLRPSPSQRLDIADHPAR